MKRRLSLVSLDRNPIDGKSIEARSRACRRKIYSCIKQVNSIEEDWQVLLQRELVLTEAIDYFRNMEFGSGSHSKKISIRQSFQLKREIITCIEKEDYSAMDPKIRKLYEFVIEDQDRQKIGALVNLIETIERVVQPFTKQAEYKLDLVESLSQKLHPLSVDTSVFTCKLHSILALHLLKLKGPLMNQKERNLVLYTLQLKTRHVKAKAGKEKMDQFQTLVFLLMQIYRIMFRLRKDEQLVLNLYNQLGAYSELMEESYPILNQHFERKHQLKQMIQSMKPVSLGLNVYEDSSKRNDAVSKTLKGEIAVQQNEFSNIMQTNTQVRKRSIRNTRLSLSKKSSEATIEDSQSFDRKQPRSLELYFLIPKGERVFLGHFELIILCPDTMSVAVTVTVKFGLEILYLFRRQPIFLNIQKLNFEKALWNCIECCFECEIRAAISTGQSLHYQRVSSGFSESESAILARIHDHFRAYFRFLPLHKHYMGWRFPIPNMPINLINEKLDEMSTDVQKRIYSKRIGMIERQPNISDMRLIPSSVCYVLYYSQQLYKMISIAFKEIVTEIVVFELGQVAHQDYRMLLDRLQAVGFLKKPRKPKDTAITSSPILPEAQTKFIQRVQQVLSRKGETGDLVIMKPTIVPEYFQEEDIAYHKSDIDSVAPIHIVEYRQMSKSIGLRQTAPPKRCVVKLMDRFAIMKETLTESYRLVKDRKVQAYMEPSVEPSSLKYMRVRLYFTFLQQCTPNTYRCYFKPFRSYSSGLKERGQNILLRLVKHCVLRGEIGYYMVLQYRNAENLLLFYVRHFPDGQQYCVVMTEAVFAKKGGQLSVSNGKLCGILMEPINRRDTLSEANAYYEAALTVKNKQ